MSKAGIGPRQTKSIGDTLRLVENSGLDRSSRRTKY